MDNILLIGDPHYKTSNSLETDQLYEEIEKYLKTKENLDFIVVLGDILDTHEKIHVQPFCKSIKFLKMLSSYFLTYVIIGNHDRINNNVYMTEEHPFTSLKDTENIIIVDKTLIKSDFCFVPYVPNGRFLEALGSNFEDKKAIFAHQEFKGCKMGAMISENGDIWNEVSPPVFSGHIHDFQQPQKNIIYTGTPFQHNFSDSEDKGIFLLQIKEKSWNLEKIGLNITKKKNITINISDFEKLVIPENCLLKIKFEGDPHIIKEVLKKKTIKEKIKKHNIRYKIVQKNTKIIHKNTGNFLNNLNERIEKSDKYINNLFIEIFN